MVPVLFLNRGLGVLMRPIRNQYLNHRLDDVGRATVLWLVVSPVRNAEPLETADAERTLPTD